MIVFSLRIHAFYRIPMAVSFPEFPVTHSQGVQVVDANGEVLATNLCQSAVVNRLSELSAALPCDVGDPLQLGECAAR
jgi:hypothetical protein